MPPRINVKPGDKYGRYTILAEAESVKGHRRFSCRCDCGTQKTVSLGNLRQSDTVSCGCYMREFFSQRNRTHGASKTRLYKIWLGMKKRCFNPHHKKYAYYGGRGIAVCEEWKVDFIPFRAWAMANGYQEDLSIERKDPNGNYDPENCKWVSLPEQMSNTRDSKPVSVKGLEFLTVAKAAQYFNIPATTIYNRLRRGVTVEEAFGVLK